MPKGPHLACWVLLGLALSASPSWAESLPRSPELDPLRHFDSAERQAQRQGYRRALAHLYASDLRRFEAQRAELSDYPLLPYLDYYRLLRYLSKATEADIQGFLTRYEATPLADRLLKNWLENLARRKVWDLYARYYDPRLAPGTEAACHGAWAQWNSATDDAEHAAARRAGERLWLAPRSQPKACDPLFDALIAGGHVTPELAWDRLALALEARRPALARYLLRFLDPDRKALGEALLSGRAWAQLAQELGESPQSSPAQEDALVFVLQRLAQRDPEAASEALARWRDQLPAHGQASVRMAVLNQQLAAENAAKLGRLPWPPAELTGESTADLVERFAEKALGEQAWAELLLWLQRMPPWMQNRTRWQYWRAHSELALGLAELDPTAGGGPQPTAPSNITLAPPPLLEASPPLTPLALSLGPRERLQRLAQERSYYGFLAADRLGAAYQLNTEPPRYDFDTLEAVAQHPAVQRAFELRALGERPEARLELVFAASLLDRAATLHLAALADRAGWHRMAIAATVQGEHWDYLDLRFPLAFEGPLRARAEATALPVSWLYAVTRQESAFMSDARSHVGALGLMQLMPSTARLVARDLGLTLESRWAILEEETNLTLGSHYLKQLSESFDGNRVLASAAYNAGPYRVRQWHQRFGGGPTAHWIERIPFDETRRYVQNVLAYAVIYGARLGEYTPLFNEPERTIPGVLAAP